MAENKVNRYATVVFKYTESATNPFANATKLMQYITDCIANYNKNRPQGYSMFDVWGFYIDPDDMSVEDQNTANNESKTIVSKSKLKH